MLPEDETFLRYYSLAGLYERLREDAALYPGHDGPALRRLGAAARPLPAGPRRGRRPATMRLPARHGVPLRPRPLPVPRGPPTGGARQIHERIEPPRVPDGTDLPRAREAARPRRRAALLPRARRRADRLGLRDDDGLPARDGDRPLGGDQGAEEAGRADGGRPRGAARREPRGQAREVAPGPRRPEAHRHSRRRPRSRGRDARGPARRAACRWSTAPPRPTSCRRARWCCSRARSGAAPARTTRRARSPSRSCARRSSRSSARLRGEPAARRRPEQILDLKVCDPAMGSGAFLVEACRQLGDALVEAWHAHGEMPAIPPDEDEVVFARRLVAQRCLYGVDRNPGGGRPRQAVALARDAGERITPLTFLDHALRHGDSLVGLSRTQIEAFHWEATRRASRRASRRCGCASTWRRSPSCAQRIREADETCPDCGAARPVGRGAVRAAARCASSATSCSRRSSRRRRPKEREAKRSEYATRSSGGEAERYRGGSRSGGTPTQPLAPFHWEIEFPEVFDRRTAGVRRDRRQSAVPGESERPPAQGGGLFRLADRHLHEGATATPTSWPTSSAARSLSSERTAPSA